MLLIFALSTASRAEAGFFDTLQKLADPGSKQGKMLSGATQVISSSKEMDYTTERTIGESLALEGLQRFGKPVDNEKLQKYVNLVGHAVAANSKRAKITYQFAVLDSPIHNAFAAPGGVIFISKGMLDIVENESELAAVLAHEVGHIAAKHAVSSIRRAQFLEGVGKATAATMKGAQGKKFESMIGDLQTVLFDKGLDKEMEFEADAAALETTYRTGYNPDGMISVLKKLKKIEAQSTKKGSWFSTHPPLDDRISRLTTAMTKYPDADTLASLSSRFKKRIQP